MQPLSHAWGELINTLFGFAGSRKRPTRTRRDEPVDHSRRRPTWACKGHPRVFWLDGSPNSPVRLPFNGLARHRHPGVDQGKHNSDSDSLCQSTLTLLHSFIVRNVDTSSTP